MGLFLKASFEDRNKHESKPTPRLRHNKRSKSNLQPRFNIKNRISQYKKASNDSVATQASGYSAPSTPLSTEQHTQFIDTHFTQAETLPMASAHGAHMFPIPHKRGRTLTGTLLPPLSLPISQPLTSQPMTSHAHTMTSHVHSPGCNPKCPFNFDSHTVLVDQETISVVYQASSIK